MNNENVPRVRINIKCEIEYIHFITQILKKSNSTFTLNPLENKP